MKRTLNTSRGSVGYWFILPWIIGFVLFFLQPIVQLVYMSFSSFKLSELGLSLEPLDDIWKHYKYALTGDSYFPVYLIGSITELLFVPVMVFFSLFSGVLLSQTFRGRTVMRAGGG